MAPLDLILCIVLMVVWPAYEHFVDLPRFRRWLEKIPERARIREYRVAFVQQWMVTIVAAWVWLHAGRSWADIGLRSATGWRLWPTMVFALVFLAFNLMQARTVAKSEKARAAARASKSIRSVEAVIPHNTTELRWFLALCVTAGFCEEFLFRGYVISALAPLLGWWPAAALAVIPFGLMHSYQGRSGIVKTTLIGVVMTLVVAATRSLIPAMVLHAIIDIGGGVVGFTVVKEKTPAAAAA